MAQFEYMPEADYNTWQASQFRKKADALVFPTLANKLIDEQQPPPPPPEQPPPDYSSNVLAMPPNLGGQMPPQGGQGLEPGNIRSMIGEMSGIGNTVYPYLPQTNWDVGKATEMAYAHAAPAQAAREAQMLNNPGGALFNAALTYPGTQALSAIAATPAIKAMARAGATQVGETAGRLATEETGAFIPPAFVQPNGGVLSHIGDVAKGATIDVVDAVKGVVNLPSLETVLEEASKAGRKLGLGSLVRMRKGEGVAGVVRTDATDLILDATRRQKGQIDQVADTMGTAIDAKYRQLGDPFGVKDGYVTVGPASGQAFQDVMEYSLADTYQLLTPQQADFVNYYHTLQDGMENAARARGVRIAVKASDPDAPRYIHRVYTELDATATRPGAAKPVGATQSFERRRTHETVKELLDAGRIKTLDDPGNLFRMYAQQVLKKESDKDLFRVVGPLGESVRSRVGEDVIQLAVDAAKVKKGAVHLVGIVKQVVAGGSPAGASLAAIRRNFPQIAHQLDEAMKVGPAKFDQIISTVGDDIWRALKTTPQDLRSALAEVRGMEAEPGKALTQSMQEAKRPPVISIQPAPGAKGITPAFQPVVDAAEAARVPYFTPTNAPVTFSDLQDALRITNSDEKTSLEFITSFYKEAFKDGQKARAEALKDVLIAAQDNMAAMSKDAALAKGNFTRSLASAAERRPGEGIIRQPAFMKAEGVSAASIPGKRSQIMREIIFPKETEVPVYGPGGPTGKTEIISGEDFASRVNKVLGPQGEQWPDAVLEPAKKVNALMKAGQIVLDLSGPAIQGFPLLMSNPARWGRAAALSYASFLNPEVRATWLARPENYAALKSFVEDGGKLGAVDFTEALQTGGMLAGVGEKLSGLPVVGGIAQRMHPGVSFGAFSDTVRVMTYDAMKDGVGRVGGTELADFAAKLTGGRSMYGPWTHPTQHTVQGLLAYAADYTRASLALAGDVFKPGLEGELARRTLGRMVVTYPAVIYMAAKASDIINGEDNLANPDSPEFVFNPDSRYFFRVPVGGDVISAAGIWPSLMRTTAKSVVAATRGDPGAFAQAWADFGTSRAGPLLGAAKVQIEGKTFRGEALNTPQDRLRAMGTSFVPLTGAAVLEGQGPGAIGAQFMGLGTSPKSLSAKRDELLDKYAKTLSKPSWDQLSLVQQDTLQRAHPEIIEARDVARSRQAFSGRGEWQTYAQFTQNISAGRERIRSEIADLTRQFKDNQMSGTQYRDEVQRREFEIGRLGKTFQGEASGKFKNMPVTPEEYLAFQERMRLTPAVKGARETAVDSGIQGYYSIGDQFADQNGFIRDMNGFMRSREEYLAALPKDIATEVSGYLNRNKDPELVKAQNLMSEYMGLRRFVLPMDEQTEDAVGDAMARIRERTSMLPIGMQNKQALALMIEIQAADTAEKQRAITMASVILKSPTKYTNPQRRIFWQQNPLLQKYYSDVVLD